MALLEAHGAHTALCGTPRSLNRNELLPCNMSLTSQLLHQLYFGQCNPSFQASGQQRRRSAPDVGWTKQGAISPHPDRPRLPSSTTILTRSHPQRYIFVIFCLIPITGKLKCSQAQPLPRIYPHYQPTPPPDIQHTASQPSHHFQLMFPIEERKLAPSIKGQI